MYKFIFYCLLFIFPVANAQELNATVEFNTSQVAATNQQVFKTLKKALTEFINTTKWTEKSYKQNEKINCSFFFNITSFDNINKFTGSLQVQASRPVFNTSYATSILNMNDKEVDFNYTEYQNLTFNPNSYDSNLMSVIAFYANMIIGVDADTFAIEGGSKAFENASNIVSQAQQTQERAWSSNGNQNRYYFVNDILSNTYTPFRRALYEYHRTGLDIMADNPSEAKENVKKAIQSLVEVASVRPNAYLTRIFFDAKADEILSLFSDGPKVEVVKLVENLNKLSPTNSSKWNQISF